MKLIFSLSLLSLIGMGCGQDTPNDSQEYQTIEKNTESIESQTSADYQGVSADVTDNAEPIQQEIPSTENNKELELLKAERVAIQQEIALIEEEISELSQDQQKIISSNSIDGKALADAIVDIVFASIDADVDAILEGVEDLLDSLNIEKQQLQTKLTEVDEKIMELESVTE